MTVLLDLPGTCVTSPCHQQFIPGIPRRKVKSEKKTHNPVSSAFMRQNVVQDSWVWRVENKRYQNAPSWHRFSNMEPEAVTGGSPLPSLQLAVFVSSAQGNNR